MHQPARVSPSREVGTVLASRDGMVYDTALIDAPAWAIFILNVHDEGERYG
jgi:hypothetical protein